MGLCSNKGMVKGEKLSEGRPRIMLVGEAPGAVEDEKGRPFMGKSGRKLRGTCIPESGISESEFYITNVCKCRPDGNETPKMTWRRTCMRLHLRGEIERIRPRVIVALGGVPWSILRPVKGSLTDACGQWHWSEEFGCYVIPMFHPSFNVRGHLRTETMIAMWKEFGRNWKDGKQNVRPDNQTTIESFK